MLVLKPHLFNEFKKSDCLSKLLFSNNPNVYAINFKGIFFVSMESFCLNEPEAAFLGFANFSFGFQNQFYLCKPPLISIFFGKSLNFIFFWNIANSFKIIGY